MNAEEILAHVNESYLPIRVPKDGTEALSPESHVREFLKCFETREDHPFDLVTPIFYQITDWKKDLDSSRKRAGVIQWFGRVPDMNKRVNEQIGWSDPRDPALKRGLTSRVMDSVNCSDELNRVLLLIYPREYPVWTALQQMNEKYVLYFGIAKDRREANVSKAKVRSGLIDLGPGEIGGYHEMIRDGGERQLKDFSHGQCNQLMGSQLAVTNLLIKELDGYIDDHSLYIDDHHALIYVFSNIVHVGPEMQRGCGGLFLSVRIEALQSIGQWLPLAERLADKVANRVVHQMQLEEVRESAMRAGVSRVMGRSLSHGIGSGTLQKLSVPGELRKRLAVDKNRPDLTSMDPGADMLTMLRSAHAALCAPEANLDQVRALLAEAEQLYTETALMSPKAEDKLRHLFRVVKDRMELLSQVATVRSGMLETWLVADIVNAFNRSDVIVQPMLREGVYAKISFDQADQAVGMVEGRIGVHGALFTLFENIIRNVSRHTSLDKVEFMLKAELEDSLPVVRMELRHTWNGTDKQLQRIKGALEEETLDASGAIRRHSWGLMELKQVCAFLREMDMTEVDKKHAPPLLEIDKVDDAQHLSWLHHVFYLPRPRTFLRIAPGQDGKPCGRDEAGIQVKQEDWVRYPIVGIDGTVNAQTIAQYLPNRCASLKDVHNKSGSELWRTYLEQQLNGKRGVKLHLYDHDDIKRTVCFGDQTSPLVGAVYHHPGVDPDKYEVQARTDHGVLTMLHAMPSNSPLAQVFSAMSNEGDHGDMWCARIAEATLTPIIILDERVQDAAWPASGQGIGHELQAMGVFVPDLGTTADLRKTTPGQVDNFLTQLLSTKSWIKDVPKSYLIIHRSVMQRMNGIEGSEKYPAYFRDQGFEVSIVSGAAGGPEIGMGDEPYVPLAALEQHAIQVPCKWQLTELVVSARRQKVEPNKSTA